jgi:hypothetical protein
VAVIEVIEIHAALHVRKAGAPLVSQPDGCSQDDDRPMSDL